MVEKLKHILVTGGAGYIGSHMAVELLNLGYKVTIIDNFSNSSLAVIGRIEQITGKEPKIIKLDLCSYNQLNAVFEENNFYAVIHFAGLKAVGESVINPLEYYRNNLISTINLLRSMNKYKVQRLIFSSSATVYGDPFKVPITEKEPIKPTNPYGHTKAMIEQILQDYSIANPKSRIVSLRYFNPIGAHSSGLIGENPNGIPNNLLPFATQVAVGKLPQLKVFGDNYDTPDGTGVRDYIHVVDLALGHIMALDKIDSLLPYTIFNLGAGRGYSVLEIIKALEQASSKKIPYNIVGRRPGDIATCIADPSKANKVLGWKVTKTLQEACVDAWRWQQTSSRSCKA